MDSPPEVAKDFRDWQNLPQELMESILLRLDAMEILMSAQKVCLRWCRLCKEPSLWRSIDMHSSRHWALDFDEITLLCRDAVARSCGQLVDIEVGIFCTDELLKYIADSSSQLKRLRLVSCHNISDEGLSEAAAKLPLLEELHTSYCSFSKEALAAVGRCCPLLKTLKCNDHVMRIYSGCNVNNAELAFAIAQNIPEIRHLQLVGTYLTDDGLQAILDGCPHLESLDIRLSCLVTLAGNLGERCATQIRDFRGPCDSADDYVCCVCP